jgi:hypothetical protein
MENTNNVKHFPRNEEFEEDLDLALLKNFGQRKKFLEE